MRRKTSETGETSETRIRFQRSEVRDQRTEDRWFETANIEPQNDDVITSIFEIPCSTFCGSKRR
jgi:hypothetical protein